MQRFCRNIKLVRLAVAQFPVLLYGGSSICLAYVALILHGWVAILWQGTSVPQNAQRGATIRAPTVQGERHVTASAKNASEEMFSMIIRSHAVYMAAIIRYMVMGGRTYTSLFVLTL